MVSITSRITVGLMVLLRSKGQVGPLQAGAARSDTRALCHWRLELDAQTGNEVLFLTRFCRFRRRTFLARRRRAVDNVPLEVSASGRSSYDCLF